MLPSPVWGSIPTVGEATQTRNRMACMLHFVGVHGGFMCQWHLGTESVLKFEESTYSVLVASPTTTYSTYYKRLPIPIACSVVYMYCVCV